MSGVESIVSFQEPLGPPDIDHPRPERLIAGDPERRTWNLYEAPQETVFSGFWECDVGAWRVAYPPGQDELCTILHGRVRLTDAWGAERSFGPGDIFLIPGGFEGTWETLETLRKVYMIVHRPTVTAPPAEARPPVDRIHLWLGQALAEALVAGDLDEVRSRITSVRTSISVDWGVPVPRIRIADDLRLGTTEARLDIDGRPVWKGEVHPGLHMVLSVDGTPLADVGIPGADPTFGMPVRWISSDEAKGLSRSSFAVNDAWGVLRVGVETSLVDALPALFGFDGLDALLADSSTVSPAIVSAMREVGCGRATWIWLFRSLLAHRRPLVPLSAVIERALAAYGRMRVRKADIEADAWLAEVMAEMPVHGDFVG